MSGLILRSRALEDHVKPSTLSYKKRSRRRRVEKRDLNHIPESIKHKLRELNRTNIPKLVVTCESDKQSSRYGELLKVHELHLETLQNFKKKCLDLENENKELRENSVKLLESQKENDQKLKSRLQREIEKSNRLDFSLCRKTVEFETELEKLNSEAKQEKTSLIEREKTLHERISKELAEERTQRQNLENKLGDAEEQLENYAKDPESNDITDLGEMYADIFEVDAGEINTYDIRLGKKTVTGVACWFELAVKDVLSELNVKFLGLLEDDLDWFINFLFKNDLAHNFCLFLGQYNEYRKKMLKPATRFNRNAYERAISEERLKFISLFSFALRKANE